MTKEKESGLWEDAIFIFDTSVLLDLYFYSDNLKKNILNDIFLKLDGRLFLPNHVEFEYLKNRTKVYKKPIQSYNSLLKPSNSPDSGYIDKINRSLKEMKGNIGTFSEYTVKENKHPYIKKEIIENLGKSFDEFGEKFNEFKLSLEKEIKKQITKLENIEKEDEILEGIKKHFRVGLKYDYNKKLEIANEGEFRYKFKIPPGYEDYGSKDPKQGFQIFGDLFVWYQVIDFAIETKKPIIFITNDNKNDWWEFDGKKNLKLPRYELSEEIETKAGCDFLMYTMDVFLFNAINYLGAKLEDKEIKEVEKIRKEKDQPNDSTIVSAKLSSLFKHDFPPIIDDSFDIFDENKSSGGKKFKSYLKKLNSPELGIFDELLVIEIEGGGLNFFFRNKHPNTISIGNINDLLETLFNLLGPDDKGRKDFSYDDHKHYKSWSFYQLFGRSWTLKNNVPFLIRLTREKDFLEIGFWGY